MSVRSAWLVKNVVGWVYLFDELSLEDAKLINRDILRFVNEGRENGVETVHIMIDGESITSQGNPLDFIKEIRLTNTPNLGWISYGGFSNPPLFFFVKTVARAVGDNFKVSETPEQALQYLKRRDPDLPNLLNVYASLKDEMHKSILSDY